MLICEIYIISLKLVEASEFKNTELIILKFLLLNDKYILPPNWLADTLLNVIFYNNIF